MSAHACEDNAGTYGDLDVHQQRSKDGERPRGVRDGQVGNPRKPAVLELLERQVAQALDSEEHTQRHRQLNERRHSHSAQADARLLVDHLLLERSTLHREHVLALLGDSHLVSNGSDFVLVRGECRGTPHLLDSKGEEDYTREDGCRNNRPEPGHPSRHVDELHRPSTKPGGGPAGKAERGKVAVV